MRNKHGSDMDKYFEANEDTESTMRKRRRRRPKS